MSVTVASHQSSSLPAGVYKHEIITVPWQNIPAFGSYSTCQFSEINLRCHELEIQFTTTGITGLTGTQAGFPTVNPASLWIQRIELIMNSQTVDTIYGDELFLLNNLMTSDETRLKTNVAAGIYSNNVVRAAQNANANSYYVTIPTSLFSQAHPALLTSAHNFQIRLYLQPLTNIVNQGTLTGTPAFTISGCNLVARVTRLGPAQASAELMALTKKPLSALFSQTRYQTIPVNSGVTQASLVLSAITGPISHLMFVARATNERMCSIYILLLFFTLFVCLIINVY